MDKGHNLTALSKKIKKEKRKIKYIYTQMAIKLMKKGSTLLTVR